MRRLAGSPVASRGRRGGDVVGVTSANPATGCQQLNESRGDFEAVLRALRLGGRYVLVGTSGGGYLVR